MKIIMTAIAAIGAMTTFVGSAIADVSINIRFGSTPSVTSYRRTYESYHSPLRQPIYTNSYRHQTYRSRVIMPDLSPSHNHGLTNYSNYNPYNSRFRDRYSNNGFVIRIR